MTSERDELRRFRDEYLDYLEGRRRQEPSLDQLTPPNRRHARLWIESLNAARGIDPRASRPSTASILNSQPMAEEKDGLRGLLETELRLRVDPTAWLESDAASVDAGAASTLLIHVRGMRIRVVEVDQPITEESLSAQAAENLASLFGMFPDTAGVLISTAGRQPVGTMVGPDDVVVAFETPSGELRPPRLGSPLLDSVDACVRFVEARVPAIEPFRHHVSAVGVAASRLDAEAIVARRLDALVASGQRARTPAKKQALTGLAPSQDVIVAIVRETLEGKVTSSDVRSRIDEAVEAA